MVEYKLVSFTTIVALWTLATLLVKVMYILLNWKHIQGNNFPILAIMLQKQSYSV